MGDLTEEEFNSLPADSNGQMSEADFNALPSEPAQQVAPVEQPSGTVDKFFKNLRRVQTDTFDKMYGVKEPDKNMLAGFSGRGEEAAAGVAGMLGFHSQPWQEKIDRQNQWMSENTGKVLVRQVQIWLQRYQQCMQHQKLLVAR